MNLTVKHTTKYPGGHAADPGYRWVTVVADLGREYGFHCDPDGSNVRDVQTRARDAKSFRKIGPNSPAAGAQGAAELEAVIKAHLETEHDAKLVVPATVVCAFCNEEHTTAELESETWLQWQCLACSNWNDKPVGGDYLDTPEVPADPLELLKQEARDEAADPARDAAASALLAALEGLLSMVSNVLTDSQLDHDHCGATIRNAINPTRKAIAQAKAAGIK